MHTYNTDVLKGILPAVVTPVDEDENFAPAAYEALLEKIYTAGVDGIYVCGQTGEGPLSDAKYRDALALCRRLSRTEGIDAVLKQHKVDAIVAPSNGPSWPTDLVNGDRYTGGNSSVAAVAGYPSITVPMGFAAALPLGMSFIGAAWSEARLIALAYAFEQVTHARREPLFLPPMPYAST